MTCDISSPKMWQTVCEYWQVPQYVNYCYSGIKNIKYSTTLSNITLKDENCIYINASSVTMGGKVPITFFQLKDQFNRFIFVLNSVYCFGLVVYYQFSYTIIEQHKPLDRIGAASHSVFFRNKKVCHLLRGEIFTHAHFRLIYKNKCLSLRTHT